MHVFGGHTFIVKGVVAEQHLALESCFGRIVFDGNERRENLLADFAGKRLAFVDVLLAVTLNAVAEYLGLPNIMVYEVASFYSMFETKPVGRHHVSVCTNIACMLRGSQQVVEHVEKKLGIKTGESTADGRIYLKREEECLAACTGAPMMMVDHVFHENLTAERIDAILDELK